MLTSMIAKAKTHNPLPVIAPSSVCVKPNSRPQSSRMPLRIEKPTPEATSVMKLAMNNRRGDEVWFMAYKRRRLHANSSGHFRHFFRFPAGTLDMHLFVPTFGFEIDDEQQITKRHGRWN